MMSGSVTFPLVPEKRHMCQKCQVIYQNFRGARLKEEQRDDCDSCDGSSQWRKGSGHAEVRDQPADMEEGWLKIHRPCCRLAPVKLKTTAI